MVEKILKVIIRPVVWFSTQYFSQAQTHDELFFPCAVLTLNRLIC